MIAGDRPATRWSRACAIGLACTVVAFAGDVPAADEDIVRAQLSRYFFPAEAVESLPAGDARELVRWLVATRRDRWAVIDEAVEVPRAGRVAVSGGYGLRVLERDDGLFLVPLPGSPGFDDGHRALKVTDPPRDGDLRTALADGTLALTERGVPVDVAPVRGDFVVAALTLGEGALRVDDFVSNALPAAISRRSAAIATTRVLDLRFNGGGRVDSAVRLLEALLGDDLAFGRLERRDRVDTLGAGPPSGPLSLRGSLPGIAASADGPVPDTSNEAVGTMPADARATGMTVIVSRHTASAAEWVARVLQLHGARLVGERTEGKCLVHDTFPAGEGQLVEFAVGRLGVRGPSGVYDYCDFGLVPDVRVDGTALIEEAAFTLARDAVRTRVCLARSEPDRLVAWQKELDLYLPPGRALRLVVEPDGELCLAGRYRANEAETVRADIAAYTSFVVRDVATGVPVVRNGGR